MLKAKTDPSEEAVSIWEGEAIRRKNGEQMLLLVPSDIDRPPNAEIIRLRVIELLSEKTSSISSKHEGCFGLTQRRDLLQKEIIAMVPVLKLVKRMGLFGDGSVPLNHLNEFIKTLIKVLAEDVYVSESGSTLISNEWLLAQNDLAMILQLAHVVPPCGPTIGEAFGYTYSLHYLLTLSCVVTFTLIKGII